jgi:3-dehydroquinate synthase
MAIINTKTYPIYIDQENAFADLIASINPSKVFVLVDNNTQQYCLYKILEIIPLESTIISIEQGEEFKNIETASFIWDCLLKGGADRASMVVNLGGGVIGDMGGFCASTYMRGIKFIQMPTTLLSQVDSSVGSKLGIDFQNVKNIIGVFEDPQAVIIETSFIKTLPYKQLLSGYAEILKHALIQDAELWHQLKNVTDLKSLKLVDLVLRNVSIKNNVVAQDPKEAGLRKILNFGHTIGHAVETILLNTDNHLLHGEAIAIGMVCESYLAYLKGFISLEEATEIRKVFLSLYGNKNKSLPDLERIIGVMKHDKKNKNGNILFSLLAKIGEGNFDQIVSEEEMKSSLYWYKEKI